jgi:hypothetical protein
MNSGSSNKGFVISQLFGKAEPKEAQRAKRWLLELLLLFPAFFLVSSQLVPHIKKTFLSIQRNV